MSAGAFCPICHHLLTTSQWNLPDFTACPNCHAPTRTLVFPAIARARSVTRPEPRRETEAGCFFHNNSRAENVCSSCGRFLCSLCTLEFGTQKLCPDCIYKRRRQSSEPLFRDQTILFDNIALLLLIIPVLCLLYVYVGLIFSGFALAIVIIGWRHQRPLVPRSRYRFVLAAALSLIEGIGWIALVWLIVWLIQSHPTDFGL
jgi:uncharacterized paraquat-inducible protein A